MFDAWDRTAGVRVSPRRIFQDERAAGLHLFPHSELPYLQPLRHELPAAGVDYLLAQRLYEYLNFTLHLETRVVNRALLTLVHNAAGVHLTEPLRLDAYRIYTDEAYHATYTLDLIQQVARDTGHEPLPYRFAVLAALDALAGDVESLAPGLTHLLQATVFETTITSILAGIPDDPGVVQTVRHVIADHAADERRHHAYFTRLFPLIWAGCDATLRRAAGRYLAHVIATCLAPDVTHTTAVLVRTGVPTERAGAVLAEVYSPALVAARNRQMARHTLRLLATYDVFDDAAVSDAFAERGLLPRSDTATGARAAPAPPGR
jgi:hypothetical protein